MELKPSQCIKICLRDTTLWHNGGSSPVVHVTEWRGKKAQALNVYKVRRNLLN